MNLTDSLQPPPSLRSPKTFRDTPPPEQCVVRMNLLSLIFCENVVDDIHGMMNLATREGCSFASHTRE